MNPFFQTEAPTTKEMWKNEPNKFRQWIIMLGISMIIFLTITIVGLAMVLSTKDSLHSALSTAFQNTKGFSGDPDKSATTTLFLRFVSLPAAMIAIILISIILYSASLVESYKAKSFSKLSAPSIFLPELIGMFALFGAISSMANSSLITAVDGNVGAILSIVAQFFAIVLLFFAWQVSRIRRVFVNIERMEALEKSPEFQQMQEQMKNFFNAAQNGQSPSSSYGPSATPNSDPIQKAKVKEKSVETNEPKEAPEVTELKKLKIAKLREIANKLSISGADKMTKNELVSTIIRVTNQK